MKEPTLKSISTLLQPNTRDLQTVLSKVKAIQTLNQTVLPLLNDRLRSHCTVANLANGVLVLLVANSAAATELRYELPDLLKKIQKNHQLRHIKEIQCKVRQPVTITVERGGINKLPEKAALLSTETANILLAMAETIEDSSLRAIMERIAKNTIS